MNFASTPMRYIVTGETLAMTEVVEHNRALVLAREAEIAAQRARAAAGRIHGRTMHNAGLTAATWPVSGRESPYQVAMKREWGVDGFANRTQRKVARRQWKSGVVTVPYNVSRGGAQW